jgi:hypothetical protein
MRKLEGGGSHGPNIRKKRQPRPSLRWIASLVTTMSKDWDQEKAFNGLHQPKKSKVINKDKGGKKIEIKNTPAKASVTSSPPKKT